MISLIVSIYKRLDFLDLVLQGMERQSYKDFELIVAEDNNAVETRVFIEQARKKYNFSIQHVSQEDIGFRKTKILNTAVMAANGDKLVFLDGDCIPHKHFLKEYAKAIKDRCVCYGRRVCLSRQFTNRLLQERNLENLQFIKALFAGSKSMAHAIYNPLKKNIHKKDRGIWGCNWGILREHIISVNGFDEDYTRACAGEDTDIEWRLKSMGFYMVPMKNKSIVYHLFHEANYTYEDDTLLMKDLMIRKIKEGKVFCTNGLAQYIG